MVVVPLPMRRKYEVGLSVDGVEKYRTTRDNQGDAPAGVRLGLGLSSPLSASTINSDDLILTEKTL